MRSFVLALFLSFLTLQANAKLDNGIHRKSPPKAERLARGVGFVPSPLNATRTRGLEILKDRSVLGLGLGTCVRVGAGGQVGSLLGSKINVGAGTCVCVDAAVDDLSLKARVVASAGAHLDVSGLQYVTTLASITLLGIADICLEADVSLNLPPLISINDPHSTHVFPPAGSCCLRGCVAGYHNENGQCVPDPPTCPEGQVLCGNTCICTKDKVCVSGVPQTRKQRRNFLCPAGLVKCPVRGAGFECVDTRADIESCGGCLFETGSANRTTTGADCTAMPNVNEVACVRGSCQIRSCRRGYTMSPDTTQCELLPSKKVSPGSFSEFKVQGHRRS